MIRPSRIACAISGAPLAPNSSVAICIASVSVVAFLMLSICSPNTSSKDLPSDAASFCAFFSAAMAVDVSTPLASNCASRFILSGSDSPISLKMAPFLSSAAYNVSIDMPVSCPAFVIRPNTDWVSSTSRPNFVMIASTWSIELFRSVPLISENSMNCCDRSPSASPVSPKRVLTSPTAIPAFSASVGMLPNTLSIWSFSASAASPVAPVLVMIVSYPASSSFAAATAPAAIPAAAAETGAMPLATPVTLSPAPFSLSPTPCSFSPVLLIASPRFSIAFFEMSAFFCIFWDSSKDLSVRDCSFCSVSMISRCSASYLSCPISSGVTFSAADLSVSRRSLVVSTDFCNSCCFCASSSVFVGSSFKSLSTSFKERSRSLSCLSADDSALSNLVTSPLISTVKPLILLAMLKSPNKISGCYAAYHPIKNA